ncbi:hypothetical protein [Methanobrevibacter woesei]|uniref:hypothetical protein n=1 Tax=Methanobrevibacter woesei TaxID=190976 RepID=UPI00320A4AD9
MTEAWERQKGESDLSYSRFCIYKDLSPEKRSLQNVVEILKKMTKSDQNSPPNKKIPSETALKNMSQKWRWVERARLYDAHEQLKESLKYEKEFTKENKKIINLIKKLINYCEDVLDDIINNNNDYALTTRLSLLSTLMGIIDRANFNIRTCYGKPAKYNDELNVNSKNEVSLKENPNVMNKSDKELEELLCVNDDFNMEEFLEQQETK